ncbi:hypothetical protein K1W54_36035, partial [Micromonospora sp. CPCC 205371]|nr:hypothetical protein [Micromonospora sp. CPCC 205371]
PAPPPPPGARDRVAGFLPAGRRRPRRRQRRTAVLTACAVVFAVAATVAVVDQLKPVPVQRFGHLLNPERIPDFFNLAPPERVWPDAVHRLPAKLPDGSDYTVADALGDGRFLVMDVRPSDESPAPSVFHPASGTVTALASSAVTAGLTEARLLMARGVGDRVVWFVDARRNGSSARELWSAPVAGGAAVKLATTETGPGKFSVAGDAVMWEEPRGTGYDGVVIRRVAAAGGPVTDVPGSTGYWLTHNGPWLTSKYTGSPYPDEPQGRGDLLNAVTGERVPWTANPKLAAARCGPTWCGGTAPNGLAALHDIDGGGYIELKEAGSLYPAMGGRLAVGLLYSQPVVWDRTTGRASMLTHYMGRDRGEPAVQVWPAPGDALMVLELDAIR